MLGRNVFLRQEVGEEKAYLPEAEDTVFFVLKQTKA